MKITFAGEQVLIKPLTVGKCPAVARALKDLDQSVLVGANNGTAAYVLNIPGR